jgi:integrase
VVRYSVPAPDKGEDKRRRHAIGLGPYPDVTLAEARDFAFAERCRRREGSDPAEAKRVAKAARHVAAAKAITFRQCAEAYIRDNEAGWKNPKHVAQWSSTLETYVYPIFGNLPVQTVDTGLVRKVLDPIWTTKPETASRVRRRIENVLGWATVSEYRQGDNPARWRGHLENLLPAKTKIRAVEHHAALPYAMIAAFMVELRQQEGVAARALEFAILTATRTGEVIGATWAEINMDERLWIIPGARMKAGKEHRVPLSSRALAILKALPKGEPGDRVFPLSNMAMLKLLGRMKRDDLTVHGFRSTFSDWCAERTAYPAEFREMALAHAIGDKVEAAYRRGDLFEKRRKVMDDWAKFSAQLTVIRSVST